MGSVGGKMGEKKMGENLQGFPNKNRLVGGFKHFLNLLPRSPGKMIQFDEHIFQLGYCRLIEICWFTLLKLNKYSPEN